MKFVTFVRAGAGQEGKIILVNPEHVSAVVETSIINRSIIRIAGVEAGVLVSESIEKAHITLTGKPIPE